MGNAGRDDDVETKTGDGDGDCDLVYRRGGCGEDDDIPGPGSIRAVYVVVKFVVNVVVIIVV